MNKSKYRVALAKQGLAAIQVARKLGVHHTTFSSWARGYYPVPEKYRFKLTEILGVSQEELFEVDHE